MEEFNESFSVSTELGTPGFKHQLAAVFRLIQSEFSFLHQTDFFFAGVDYFFWNISVNKTGCNLSENLAELSSFWLWSLCTLWWTDIDYKTNRPIAYFAALSDCILAPLYYVENMLQITPSCKKELATIYSAGLMIRPNRTRAIKYYITWILLYRLCLLAVTLNLGQQTSSHETFLSKKSCDLNVNKNDYEMMTMMHFSFKNLYKTYGATER